VCAPGKTERPAFDRVKTDKRDAIRLARLLAAGELTLVTIPSIEREQLRDLVVGADVRTPRRGSGGPPRRLHLANLECAGCDTGRPRQRVELPCAGLRLSSAIARQDPSSASRVAPKPRTLPTIAFFQREPSARDW